MSRGVEVATTGDAQQSGRHRALLPAILATTLGGALLALAVFLIVVGELVAHSALGRPPAGVTYLPDSGSDRLRTAAEQLGPVVVAVGLLVLTWRCRGRGRVRATRLCAMATVVVSVAALL